MDAERWLGAPRLQTAERYPGYPADAARFWQAIRPAAARLGLPEAAVWRCR